MELNEIFAKRRSVRKYDGTRPVSREQLETMIAAAQEAPTWKNTQTGRYYAVTGQQTLKALKECLHPQNQLTVADAPALIVTTFKKNISGFERSGEQTNELGNEWGVYDLALQNAFLMLKATEIGLDTIVLGLRDAEQIRTLLNVPEEEIIVSVIGVGYRDEEPTRPKRKEISVIAKFFEE